MKSTWSDQPAQSLGPRAGAEPAPGKFAERLKRIRIKRKLTQAELARAAGMQPSAIAHFEADRRKPGYDSLIALANGLMVSVDTLLGAELRTTAFRHEERLTARDRAHIQGIIDLMTDDKS